MIGKPGFAPTLRLNPLRKQWVAVAVGLLLVLSLHCFELHAALLFRGVAQVDGQQRWAPVRNYNNPADIAYPQDPAGRAIAAEEVRVILSGEVTHADVDSAAVMEGLIRSGKQKIAGNTVWFASNGGDIDAGMRLGRLLRNLGVFTLIGRNDQCLSACVFAFMGGARRSVAGRLGIHRPYFPLTEGTPDRQARFRHLQLTLRNFIDEMDFPDSLYEAVMLVPPESMQFVVPADLKKFYLEGVSPSTEDIIDAASARRRDISMFEYLKRKAAAPACAFFDAGEGRCEGRVQEAAAGGAAAENPRSMQTGEATPASGAVANPAGNLIQLSNPSTGASRDPT